MAKLSASQRRKTPKKDFGVPSKAPGSGSYPMPDKAHARAALRMLHNAPPAERAAIRRKADAKLGRSNKARKNHRNAKRRITRGKRK